MRGVLLDKNSGDRRWRDACRKENLVECDLLPRHLRDESDVQVMEHAIERAILVARGKEIALSDLPEPLQADPSPGGGSAPPPGSLEEIERVSIVRALESTGWNKQAAAQVLGLRRPTLYSKMRRHGIPQRRA